MKKTILFLAVLLVAGAVTVIAAQRKFCPDTCCCKAKTECVCADKATCAEKKCEAACCAQAGECQPACCDKGKCGGECGKTAAEKCCEKPASSCCKK